MTEIKVQLRQIEMPDVAQLNALQETPFHKVVRFPFGFGQAAGWLEGIAASNVDSFFVITAAKEGSARVVGLCGLTKIDWVSRHAEIFFAMIDKDKAKASIQEQAATTTAFQNLLQYGFRTLNLNRLYVCIADNNKSLNSLEAAGFIIEGISEEAEFLDGKMRQTIHLALLATEYENARHNS